MIGWPLYFTSLNSLSPTIILTRHVLHVTAFSFLRSYLLCSVSQSQKGGGGNPIDNEKSENIVFVTGTILKFYLHYLLHHTNVFWLAK